MKAVHFGAGNIGRGFIGLLLSQSGYQVCFVDVNETLVSLLKSRQSYTVTLANDQASSSTVNNITAINGSDQRLVAKAIAEADIVTTAVGKSALKHIAAAIAAGIELRLTHSIDSPLPVIACENAIGGSTQLKRFVYEHLHGYAREQADHSIVFPDAIVDRIVPLQSHEDLLQVTVEPFFEWIVDCSAMPPHFHKILGVHYEEQLLPYIERKLFTVNTGHCIVAYYGYLHGYKTIQDAMKDPLILAEVKGALLETGAILVQKYQFDSDVHKQYINQTLERFGNPHLTDEVIRVARSPIRKISPHDRLVRPALLAYERGLPAVHLATAIAAVLHFNFEADPEALELQNYRLQFGLHQTIEHYTGLPKQHLLHVQIIEAYNKLWQFARQRKDGK